MTGLVLSQNRSRGTRTVGEGPEPIASDQKPLVRDQNGSWGTKTVRGEPVHRYPRSWWASFRTVRGELVEPSPFLSMLGISTM